MTWAPDTPLTEDVLSAVLGSPLPWLPPERHIYGATEIEWWERTPGEVIIRSTGGTSDDRHYAQTLWALQLASHGYQRAQFDVDDVIHPESGRISSVHIAGWPDIMAKAKRLIQSGQVTLLRNGFNYIVGHVIGDHGEYDTEISRDDPSSRTITGWQCTCPWDQYAWQRTRKWKKYEGRPCAHTMALYWKALATSLDEQLSPDQAEALGTGQKLPAPPVADHPPGHEPGGPEAIEHPKDRAFGPEGPIQGDQLPLNMPPDATGGPPGPAQAPMSPPPGPGGPQPPGILPPFPGEQQQIPWGGPGTTPGGGVSPPGAMTVPGAKPTTPFNPIQGPGTYSKVAAIPLDQIAYIAEGAMERGGMTGRQWHVPEAEVKQYRQREPGSGSLLHPVEEQMTAFARQVTGDDHIKVMASGWFEGGDITSGSTDFLNFINVRFDTNDLVILHECAHVMKGSPGHDAQWMTIAHDLYGKYLGQGAAETFWNLVQPYVEEEPPEAPGTLSKVAQVMYHVAPASAEADIQARGLQPHDANGYSYADEVGDPAGVYLWPTRPEPDPQYSSSMGSVYHPADQHVYEVDVTGLTLQRGHRYSDPLNDAHYVEAPISPERVKRMSKTSDFNAPEPVRAKKPLMGLAEGPVPGQYGDGEYREVPAGTPGEVRHQDPTTGWIECAFDLNNSGENEPYRITVFVEPGDIESAGDLTPSDPAIRRHTKVAASQVMYHVSPSVNRDSILRQGLLPQPQDDQGPQVYLSARPEGVGPDTDTWEVVVEDLPLQWVAGDWWKCAEPIPPQQLRLSA